MAGKTLAARKAELKKVGRLVRDHKAHLRRRDELIRELAGEVSRPELAELADVTPGRISQITEEPTE